MSAPQTLWKIGPRDAWDHVTVYGYPSRERALANVPCTVSRESAERIVQPMTPEETAKWRRQHPHPPTP